MNRRSSFAGLLAILITAAPCAYAGSLKFTADVPQPPAQLPLLRLTPQPPPIDLMNELLAASPVPAKLAPLGGTPLFEQNKLKVPSDVIGAVEDEHVRAWVNRKTGDASVYPNLARLEPLEPADVEAHASRAREIFQTAGFIAHDDTRFVVGKPDTLNGQTMTRDPSGGVHTEKPKAGYLNYFSARRFVGDLPVDGPGSRALLELAKGGAVEGLVRVWKSAKTVRMVRPSLKTQRQVQAAIARQLRPALANSDVIVDRIELAYYDSNKAYIQPVYRFTAQIHHITSPPTPPGTDDDFVIGYIPFAQPAEPLPTLGKGAGPSPRTPPKKKATEIPGRRAASNGNDPLVGRYVVRQDDPNWVNDANSFWSSLSSTWTGSSFTNSQYYWAEPRLFTNEKDSFINQMNLALVEVHGNWWIFWTFKNTADTVKINGDIPSPGYGPSANGALADWVIHSCEVVPSPDDTANWPDPWWTVFGGVRNVVGYRTIMYINDQAGGPYGNSLGNLAPVVSSWLGDVISLNAYSGRPTLPAHGGVVRPLGRPATISFCGHDGDSVLSTGTLGRANCLTVWWFPD
jgi:hypothetical protein